MCIIFLYYVIYDDIKRRVNALEGTPLSTQKLPSVRQGGNECVSMQHAAAREAFRVLEGSPPVVGGCSQIIVV